MSDRGPDEPTQSMPGEDGDEPVPGEEAAPGVPGEPSLFADSPRPTERPADATWALTASDEPPSAAPPEDAEPDGDWITPEPTGAAPGAPAADGTAVMGDIPEAQAGGGGGVFGPGGPYGGGGGDDGGPGGPYDEGPLEPDEPAPWYRQRGPVAALIAGIAALVMIVIAIIVLTGDDDSDVVDPGADTSSTVETSTTRERPRRTTTTPPPTTAPPTTVPTTPPPTTPPPTPPPTTPPPTTPPPTTQAPTTQPPTTQPPTTQPPTTLPPTTTTAGVVIPPQPDPTVWEILRASPDLSKARDYVEEAGFRDGLDDPEFPVTFLAPTNDAFELVEQSPGGEDLLNDRDRLRELLLRHVVEPPPVTAEQIFSSDQLPTAGGDVLEVDTEGRTIEDATILAADIEDGGGIVQAIDLVLLP